MIHPIFTYTMNTNCWYHKHICLVCLCHLNHCQCTKLLLLLYTQTHYHIDYVSAPQQYNQWSWQLFYLYRKYSFSIWNFSSCSWPNPYISIRSSWQCLHDAATNNQAIPTTLTYNHPLYWFTPSEPYPRSPTVKTAYNYLCHYSSDFSLNTLDESTIG